MKPASGLTAISSGVSTVQVLVMAERPAGKDGALGDVSERVFKVPKRDIRS